MKPRTKRAHPLLYTALLALGAIACLYAALGVFPFGQNSVITGDLNGQYIPYFAHYRAAAGGAGGMAATFEKSLGGSLLGIFAYYCSSPFNLLYLVVPVAWYAAAAGLVLAAKLTLASVFFSFFAGRHYPGLPAWGRAALGVSYGLCAYSVVYSQNIMWHDVVLLIPLICWGLDELVRKGRPLAYGLVLALAIFANFYIGYMACLFAVIYFAYLLVTQRPGGLGGCFGKFAGASLAAGLVNGWLLLPALSNINESKGELFSVAFSLERNFSPLALVQRLLPGNFAWQDVTDGLPNLYCGMLAVLLAGAFFLSRKVPLRQKLAGGAVLAVLALSFWLKGLDVLWHGLKAPVWFPYRYSFLFSFWLAFLAAGALYYAKLSFKLAGGALAGCGALFAVAYLFRQPAFSRRALLAGAAVTVVLAAGLWLAGRQKRWAPLLALACAAELCCVSFLALRQFEPYTTAGYAAYVQQGKATVAALQKAGDEPVRMEKTGFRTLNDPMLLGYWGISHFGSTQDNASTDTLVRLGYGNYGACNTYLYGSTPAADALLGIRWLMAPPGGKEPPAYYNKTEADTPWPVYENPYALPLALTAPAALAELELENGEDLFLWQQRILRALAGEQVPTLYIPVTAREAGENTMEFTAQADGPCYAFFAPQGIAAVLVNGEEMGLVGDADRQGVVYLGEFKAGQAVMVQLSAPFALAGCYTLDEAALAQACETIRARAPRIETMEDGTITVIAQGGPQELLWLSTGYAAEWQAAVNGENTGTVKLAGAFLGVPLQEGENSITLRWKTTNIGLGWAVTAVGAALFAGLAALGRRERKKQRTQD